MLNDNLSILFSLLNCNNANIAKYMNCHSSYISLICSNKRELSPKSKPILRLVNSIYDYADKKNLLNILCDICNCQDVKRETLVPSVINWLFKDEKKELSDYSNLLSSKTNAKQIKSKSFGDKLSTIMEMLKLSNAKLAKQIYVDYSYISRFRNGLRYPQPSSPIAKQLVNSLFNRVIELDYLPKLAILIKIDQRLLSDSTYVYNAFSSWLFDNTEDSSVYSIDTMLESISSFSLNTKLDLPDTSTFVTKQIVNSKTKTYWGLDGLREAVIRFLGTSNEPNSILWLYSDQPMDWMISDKSFFYKWYSLMFSCLKKGIKIKIIHNLDRNTKEMMDGIRSWLSFYMSGLIEPYFCCKQKDTKFNHTIFLKPNEECISSYHVSKTENSGWYDYITDSDKVKSITKEFEELILLSEPLVKVYKDNHNLITYNQNNDFHCLLTTLSLGSMPDGLMTSIINNNCLIKEVVGSINSFCSKQRDLFNNTLSDRSITEYIVLPTDEEFNKNNIKVNIPFTLHNLNLYYTKEQYSAHIKSILNILETKPNYDLHIIPEIPFKDIQIIMFTEKVIVLRSEQPYIAFVFFEPLMINAFEKYFEKLYSEYKIDKSMIKELLQKYI